MILSLILRFNSNNFNLGVLTLSCSSENVSVTIAGVSNGIQVFCKGAAAVYRVSFILSSFFGLMLILSLISERFHRGFWLFKILLVVGGVIGSFFMSNGNFNTEAYDWVSRIGSFVFLVLQIFFLIDFAYAWNEDWVERGYRDSINNIPTNKWWLIAVLTSAALLYCFSLAGIIIVFIYYASCTIGKVFASLTIVWVVGISLLSLFRDKIVGVEGAILPAAVVSAYAVYLCWSSLESNPDTNCTPPNVETAATVVIGALIATLTLVWSSFSLTTNSENLLQGEELEPPPEGPRADPESAVVAPSRNREKGGGPVMRSDVNTPATDEDDDSPVYAPDRPWMFHLVMISASMYLAMLLTDWGTFEGSGLNITTGTASLWVKIVAQWITLLLFTWTLIAPGVLKNRDFS